MIIIQTTTSSKKEAKVIASRLVEKELAACVQISKISSIYIWDNKTCDDKEFILVIKTKKSNYKKCEKLITKLHSYEVPEIISMKINKASKEYKQFVQKNTI